MSKHKVFICYYHKDDENYRNRFERLFGHLVVLKSVKLGDINEDLSASYIKRLIQENHLDDTSVLIVLVGPNTHCRKHVDWEISAALNKKVGGYSGVLGICLPSHDAYKKDTYNESSVPPRLVDNLKTGYSSLYDWTDDPTVLLQRIETAFQNRISKSNLIDNSRPQFIYNRCD
jgi:hypothetical protein